MIPFSVTYLLAVILGVATLYFNAAQRFEEPSTTVPPGFKRLGLAARLMTRPDKYQRGLSLYIGITLILYLAITVFPQAIVALLRTAQADQSTTPETERVFSAFLDTENPTLPLAVALIMTSSYFNQLISQPELFIRQLCHTVAGIPTDLAFVTRVVLDATAQERMPSEIEPAAARLGISSFGDFRNTPEYGRIISAWENAVRVAHTLEAIHSVAQGLRDEDLRSFVDYPVFENLWPRAAERIDDLRTLSRQFHQDFHSAPKTSTETEDKSGMREYAQKSTTETGSSPLERSTRQGPETESDGRTKIKTLKVDPDREARLATIYQDLATLLAAALASRGTRDLWASIIGVGLGGERKLKIVELQEQVDRDVSSIGISFFKWGIAASIVAWLVYFPLSAFWWRAYFPNVDIVENDHSWWRLLTFFWEGPDTFIDWGANPKLELAEYSLVLPFQSPWQLFLSVVAASAATGGALVAAWRFRWQLLGTRNYTHPEISSGDNAQLPTVAAFGAYAEVFLAALKTAFVILIALQVASFWKVIEGGILVWIEHGIEITRACKAFEPPISLELAGQTSALSVMIFGALVGFLFVSVPPALAALLGIVLADRARLQTKGTQVAHAVPIAIAVGMTMMICERSGQVLFTASSVQSIAQLYMRTQAPQESKRLSGGREQEKTENSGENSNSGVGKTKPSKPVQPNTPSIEESTQDVEDFRKRCREADVERRDNGGRVSFRKAFLPQYGPGKVPSLSDIAETASNMHAAEKDRIANGGAVQDRDAPRLRSGQQKMRGTDRDAARPLQQANTASPETVEDKQNAAQQRKESGVAAGLLKGATNATVYIALSMFISFLVVRRTRQRIDLEAPRSTTDAVSLANSKLVDAALNREKSTN